MVTGPPGPCGCGCALDYDTSYGFEAVDYARDVLGSPYLPWQRWLVIHAGELLPDGYPRFSFVLVLVARQNGKTDVVVRLVPYWLTEALPSVLATGRYEDPPVVLGTSTKVEYAKETWEKVLRRMQRRPWLADLIPSNGVRRTNGEQELAVLTNEGELARYKIAAQNDDAGRSLTVVRGVLDEMRQMSHYDAYDALVNATNAVHEAQVWGLTNQGDERAVVLDQLRDSALLYIHTSGADGDPRLGLFEWSGWPGCDPADPAALAAANPALGDRIRLDNLIGRARRAKAAGGDQLARFLIEVLCMRVRKLDPAIPEAHWLGCLDPTLPAGDWSAHRGRVASCLDVSMDGLHATLAVGAVMGDGRVRLGVAGAWDGPDATTKMKAELPGLLRTVRPRVLAWFPNGPAAAVAAELAKPRGGRPSQLPTSVRVREVRGEATTVCMGLAELAKSAGLAHEGDPLLEQHATGAERLWQGDAWRFVRKGAGHCDAAYAAAGAAHEARVMPVPVRPGVVKPSPRS